MTPSEGLPPFDSLIAVTDYLVEQERDSYRTTAKADRPFHIYRHVLELRRWVLRHHRSQMRALRPAFPATDDRD